MTEDTQAAPAARSVALCKTYGTGQAAVHALAGITVTFERGRFTAVTDPSGSGKSTLMHCMAGLDRPTSGQAFVSGLDIGTLDDAGIVSIYSNSNSCTGVRIAALVRAAPRCDRPTPADCIPPTRVSSPLARSGEPRSVRANGFKL